MFFKIKVKNTCSLSVQSCTVQNFVYATNYVFLSFGQRISRSLAQDSLFMKRERASCWLKVKQAANIMEVGLSEVRVFLNISHERNSLRYIRLRLSPLNTNFLRLFTTREAITWRADPSRWRKEIERGKIKFTVTKLSLASLWRPYPDYTLGERPGQFSQVIPSAKEVSPATFLGERRTHPSLRLRVYEVLQHWHIIQAIFILFVVG